MFLHLEYNIDYKIENGNFEFNYPFKQIDSKINVLLKIKIFYLGPR